MKKLLTIFFLMPFLLAAAEQSVLIQKSEPVSH